MKKILSLLLAMVLVLSLAACGGDKPEPTTEPTAAPTTEPTTAPTTEPTEAPTTEPAGEKTLSSFSMTVMENFAPVNSLYIADNGDGTVYVDYMGEFRKQSLAFDAAALTEIANALATLDLTTLGEGGYEDEVTTSCSLYVSYTDGSMVMYDYAGTEIPAAFTAMLNTMDAAFQTALADLEVYVPQAMVMGEVDADILAAMQEILNNSGIANLDSLGIMEIPMDEFFGMTAGLSGSDGLTAGAICQNQMMGGAVYSLVIVKMEDQNAVAFEDDFEANLDFGKWVCTRPSDAMIAHKGDLVLCLMATDATYTGTATAIENAGWTVYKTLTDPGM